MAKQAVYDYSTTASSNSDFDGTDSSGATGKVKDGDNYARSIASHIKGFANDLGGINTVAGTGDAVTITLSSAPSALVDGMRLTFNASAATTGAAATITVTPNGGASFGSKKFLKWSAGVETALAANDVPGANALVEVIYDTARDTAAGAWMLLGSGASAGLLAANNLSDVANVATARTNLGLGFSGQTLLSFFPTDNEPPSTNYATFDVRNGHPMLVFPDAVVYAAIFTGVMPRRYGAGGLTILINWMNSTTSTLKVCFSATLERVDVGTTDLDADSFGTQVIDTTGIAANATSGIQSQTSIALTVGAQMDSVVAGDCFRLKITRETGQANDTQAGDAQIVSIEIKET